MWRTLINRMIFSCILADVIIGIVVKARGGWEMVFALLPLVVILVVFKWYCMKTFDPDMDYYQRNASQANESAELEPSSKSVNRAAARFRHPVLDMKLMTPMVPAKARHVVQQIYAGRLGSEVDAGPSAFSDIPMQPIKQAGDPPQHQSFETVPEGQLDYAFYKNRSDFGNVGGDRLSRYDMITSRPGTPAFFGATRAQSPYNDYKSTSPYGSRSGSPAAAYRNDDRTKSNHPALRSQHSRYSSLAQVESNDDGDISMHPPHGPYTDPNDDRANLLTDVGPDLHTPNGEFMTMDRWRTPGAAAPYTAGDNPGSYDYFKGYGGLR